MNNFLCSAANEILVLLAVGSVFAASLTTFAWLLIRLFRVHSSVYRHLIWLYCLIGTAALPVVWCYSPKVKCPVLPQKVLTSQDHISSVIGQPPVNISPVPVPLENFPPTPLPLPSQQLVKTTKTTFTMILTALWLTGFSLFLLRLAVGWLKIRRLTAAADPVHGFENLVAGSIKIVSSKRVKGPVCFGIFKPVILIPQNMIDTAGPTQLDMVLNHELAHIQRHDPLVNLFQRLLEAVFFFHPLVWYASLQLTQTREQICDNHVLAHGTPASDYAQLLARVADARFHPQFQGAALFEGSLLHRIKTLLDTQGRLLTRVSRRTAFISALVVLVAFTLVGTLRLEAKAAKEKNNPPITSKVNPVETLTTTVKVVDETGKPVAGAVVKPIGLRTKQFPATGWGWYSEKYGEPKSQVTDSRGIATISYPKYTAPDSKTGTVCIRIDHPDFCPKNWEVLVDGTSPPAVLVQGSIVRVSGYLHSSEKNVPQVFPQFSDHANSPILPDPKTWKNLGNGILEIPKLPPGLHYFRLVYFPENGPACFSDPVRLENRKGKTYDFRLELKPGLRLDGKLDPSVPRPVRNGRVTVLVRRPDQKYTSNTDEIAAVSLYWHTWRKINEDGTFTFDSLPPGPVELIALCDGYSSKNPPGTAGNDGIPQMFLLQDKDLHVELAMEPTAVCQVVTADEKQIAVPGSSVAFWPQAKWNHAKTASYCNFYQIFARPFITMEDRLRGKTEELGNPHDSGFFGITGADGTATIHNLPGRRTSFTVDRDGYLLPAQSKDNDPSSRNVDLSPGKNIIALVALHKIVETPKPATPKASLWKKKFYETYHLTDTEVLKRLPPPFIPERKDFYRNELSTQASAIPETPEYFNFHWDNKLNQWGYGFCPPLTLDGVLRMIIQLSSYEFSGPDNLLAIQLPGDWIVRKNAAPEARLRALEKVLQTELRRSVHFEKRKVLRDVIIASGKYEFHPRSDVYNSKLVHLFSDKLDPDERSGGGTGSRNGFLRTIGDLIGIPVINQTQGPEVEISYGHHRSANLQREYKDNIPPDKIQLLLKNVARQTSLTFTRRPMQVEVWFLIENNKPPDPHK